MERETLELGGLKKIGKEKLVSIVETMIFLKFGLVRHYIIRLTTLSNLQYTFFLYKGRVKQNGQRRK